MSDRHRISPVIILCRPSRPRPAAARPVAARTRLLLEGPVLSTLLRLAAPNVLNLLAIAGMITFDGLFLGRLGPDALAGVSLAFPFVMLMQHAANERHGRRRFVGYCTRARRGRRDRRRCARFSRIHSGACARGGVLDHDAAWRAVRVSVDGRTWRNAVRRARLFERGVQRRRIHLHAEFARQCCARDRQHGPARRRHRRQRDRACPHLAIADFRMGTVARPWSGRCRLGPDDVVRRRQPRAARLPALVPLARHFGISRRVPAVGAVRRNPQGRRAGIDQCDHHQPLGRAADRDRRPSGARGGHRLRDGRAARIHPDPAGVRFRHRDRRDGRHQLGRQAISPGPRDRAGPEPRPWRLRAQRSD